MTEADTEKGFVSSEYFFDSFDSIVHRLRIARAIRDEVAIRRPFLHLGESSAAIKYLSIDASVGKALEDVLFDAAVEHGYFDR